MNIETLEAEHRPTKSTHTSRRKVVYALLVIMVFVVALVLAANNWTSVQTLFLNPKKAGQLSTLVEESARLKPELSVSKPVTGQKVKRDVPIGPAEPIAKSPAAVTLPSLDNSDDLFRKQWTKLWSENSVASWAGAEQLVRKATVLMDNLAQGKIVRNLLGGFVLKPSFMADLILPAKEEGSVDVYRLNPASYQRYSSLVTSITEMDSDQFVRFYLYFRPLIQQAYRELGYVEGGTDSVILNSLRRIQAVPTIDGEILLVRPKVMYQFQNQELEQRSDLDKQLIRMGPANMRALQQKASELEEALTNR